jgi:SnoaL-like domain
MITSVLWEAFCCFTSQVREDIRSTPYWDCEDCLPGKSLINFSRGAACVWSVRYDEFNGLEKDGRKGRWEIEMDDRTVRAALERHWSASDAGDFDVEHEIYREDALLDYPQSGERIRGRHNIQESRYVQPNKKRFAVRRMIGSGDLWVTEFVLSYDGKPSYTVSIMEFRDGLVAHETQYFADPFDPAPSRAHLVERMDGTTS